MNEQHRAAMTMALEALSAMLTHMGMDEDEWNKPTFDQARESITAIKEALAQPDHIANAGKVIEPSDYDREFWGDGQPQGEWVYLTDDELKAALEVHQVGLSVRIAFRPR